jgi:beta-galactosidase
MRRRDFVARLAVGGGALTLNGDALVAALAAPSRGVQTLGNGWRFTRVEDAATASEAPAAPAFDDTAWDSVSLPHTARMEGVVTGAPGTPTAQWQGICWYRRAISVDASAAGARVWLRFGAAMNVAALWLDGRPLGTNLGGFTPFAFDITDRIVPGRSSLLAVRLDNRDNAVTGPKPLADLDFNMYGGLYRAVELVIKDALHITDPILADRPGSGGVLVQTLAASAEQATVRAQVHVRNAGATDRRFVVRHRLVAANGRTVATYTAPAATLAAGADSDVTAELTVPRPALWHPRAPSLHTLHTDLLEAGRVIDAERTRVGIRRFSVGADGLRINGERIFLRGTNRHQEYPYLGYAVPDDAQHRDARLIKDAEFDYIRLSHYPHAPAFMDACDELGILVMDCIPGWQYFNRRDAAFTELQYENVRRMMRRDRNHACVLLWETSLNETDMPAEFVARSHAIGHAELPGDQTFTCGWTAGYDVFIQARQHGGCVNVKDKACVVSEYGDWEYYAQNAGLSQTEWANLVPDHANSRQLRWHGEKRLLQQATNFQEAHNDNRKTIAFADGLWVMFDYNRGYAPDIESSGCADLFRVPKPSYDFFRSQRDATERLPGGIGGPMVRIASDWTADSSTAVRVFSNAEEVELRLNGTRVARRRPDRDRLSTHLAHPPFTFAVPRFEAGVLEATAFIGARAVATHRVRTPGAPSALRLRLDEQDRPFGARGSDAAFLHASLVDANGTLAVQAWENVRFGATGAVRIVGANPYSTEAGVASTVLTTEVRRPRGAVYALAIVPLDGHAHLMAASLDVGGRAARFSLRYTTDGSEPTARSARYAEPVAASDALRAALCVGDRVVAQLAAHEPRFRVAGSTAPTPTAR